LRRIKTRRSFFPKGKDIGGKLEEWGVTQSGKTEKDEKEKKERQSVNKTKFPWGNDGEY